MRVYLNAPAHLSRGIHRVATALRRTAPPGVEIVEDARLADLTIHHLVGAAHERKTCQVDSGNEKPAKQSRMPESLPTEARRGFSVED